jgi:hypothetical protein
LIKNFQNDKPFFLAKIQGANNQHLKIMAITGTRFERKTAEYQKQSGYKRTI